MSLDYTTCFRIEKPATISWLGSLHLEFGVTYQRSCSKLEFNDSGFLAEKILSPDERNSREEELDHTSLVAQFSTDNFTYTIGIVEKFPFSYALMEISDKSVDHMASSLRKQKSDFLTYLVMMSNALGSTAMVTGIDCSFEFLTSFIDGTLSQADIKQNIVMASRCNDTSMRLLRTCGGKDIIRSNSMLVVRWLPGI